MGEEAVWMHVEACGSVWKGRSMTVYARSGLFEWEGRHIERVGRENGKREGIAWVGVKARGRRRDCRD